MEKNVECYSGVEYPEQPRRFLWEGTWRAVARVAAEARTADGKEFTVIDGAGGRFQLAYRASADRWTVRPAG